MWSVRSNWRRLKISIQSRHSRRTVPTKRSAKALAFGAFSGVRMIDPFSSKDLIERVGELAVAVVDQEPKRRHSLGERPREVSSLLRDPCSARVLGTAGQVHPTTPELDEEEH